jgi:predicted nucleic acid-binding Zn ribbon protein
MNSYLRARVISEWRGLPDRTPKPDRLTTAAEGVVKLMKSLGLGERLRQEEVLSAWRGIVGDFIADHSQPSKLQNGVLLVQVLQPTMHYELDRVWKTRILEKLRAQFGPKTVREIRFRIG